MIEEIDNIDKCTINLSGMTRSILCLNGPRTVVYFYYKLSSCTEAKIAPCGLSDGFLFLKVSYCAISHKSGNLNGVTVEESPSVIGAV